ncbi:MAG: hypothetical protein ACR2FH_10380, partial [Caulobacteraceae bacterium]
EIMSDLYETPPPPPAAPVAANWTEAAPPAIAWPAIFAGALVAVAAGAMLALLGVALGAGAFNPFDLARGGGAGAFTIAAGVWAALANAVALFFGAFVASRAAARADGHGGMLHGLMVWAVAFLAALLIAGLASGPPDLAGPGPNQNGVAAADLAAPAPAGVLRSDGTYLRADGAVTDANGNVVGQQAAPGPAAAPAPAPTPLRGGANPTVTMALWAFLAMLIGAVAAILGGRYGARRHAWEARLAGHAPPEHAPPRL